MNHELLTSIRDSYLSAVLDGNTGLAQRAVDQALSGGIIPSRIYLDVLMPAQVEVGARWAKGDATLPQEHVATQITLSQMARLRMMLKTRLKLGLKALVTSVEGDPHFVGAQAVADFLIMDGWEVDFLGANTPTHDVVSYIKARGCHLVCASATLAEHVPQLRNLAAQIKKMDAPPKFIFGGFAFLNDPSLISTVVADGFARDPQEAVTLGRNLCGVLSSENALAMFLRKLGQSLHEYRKMRGMSQQELADSADLDRAYISAVEHGKQNISIGAISKLAAALKISIEELLMGS
jgi:methanogenic corrinoid protein MtbC1/DNA-binding XRE family transcriptional regulator